MNRSKRSTYLSIYSKLPYYVSYSKSRLSAGKTEILPIQFAEPLVGGGQGGSHCTVLHATSQDEDADDEETAPGKDTDHAWRDESHEIVSDNDPNQR